MSVKPLSLAVHTWIGFLTSFSAIAKYKPQDATTNPSLILAASKKAEYAKLIDAAVAVGKKHSGPIDEQVEITLDILLVEFGREILKIVPGRVSTEVDASLSFDTQGSVDKALKIIDVSGVTLDDFSVMEPTWLTKSYISAVQAAGHRQGARTD